LHPTFDKIKNYLSLDILPNEVGGKAGSMMDLYSKVLKNVEDHGDFFYDEERLMRVDESLRMGKAKSRIDFFGIDGNFKKLDID
jgi:hypothetical protein